jgi:S1-C subfamily serine protease
VQAALWGKEAGDTVNAKILRGGELKEIEITLGERPANEGRTSERKGWRRRDCR